MCPCFIKAGFNINKKGGEYYLEREREREGGREGEVVEENTHSLCLYIYFFYLVINRNIKKVLDRETEREEEKNREGY